jgi:hypothetical protein
MEKTNKMLYFDVMKGFLISAVIIGHSFILVTSYITTVTEKMIFVLLCKLLSPCVFCFFYFFSYGQGLKRRRNNPKRLRKRVSSIFVSYLIWASFAWISFQLLGADYNLINNTKGIGLDKPYTLRYLGVLFTFSGSWQYYFIFIFIVSMFFLYFFKSFSVRVLKFYLILFSSLQVLFFLFITLYLWQATPNPDNLKRLGLFIYANPIVWSIPLFWGYYRAAAKKEVVEKVKSKWFYLLLVAVYCFAVIEIYVLSEKWNGYYLLDQFTLITLLNSILLIRGYDAFVRRLINHLRKDSPLLVFTGRMGRYSIIPYFVHLPYQWFLFVLLTQLTHVDFSPIPAFLIISSIGLFLSYYVIKLIELLPVKIKRLLMGI